MEMCSLTIRKFDIKGVDKLLALQERMNLSGELTGGENSWWRDERFPVDLPGWNHRQDLVVGCIL